MSPREPATARVEAVLFLAGEPLSSRKISQSAGLADGTQARTLIRRLNEMYDRSGTAFRVEEVAGGFQLLTRRPLGAWLRRWHGATSRVRLSAPALETLAVVAYRQPVLRAEVEAIRGVQCGEMLQQLMDRDLVRICGRSTELGRPFLYGTTKEFLQVFGLRHLDELPRADELRSRSGQMMADEAPGKSPSVQRDTSEELPVSITFDRVQSGRSPLSADTSPVGSSAGFARAEQAYAPPSGEEEDDLEDEEEEDDDWDEDEDEEDEDWEEEAGE